MMTESEWKGFCRLDFDFEDRKAILICPPEPRNDRKWLYKTEYFNAFPAFEIEAVKRGYYLAHMENRNHWGVREDTDARHRFSLYLQKEFGLFPKCMPVGMSCGGLEAVYFAAEYPDDVAAMYLDAPVMNLLSCPCGVGGSDAHLYEEFHEATGMTRSDLINYRNHPVDRIRDLLEHRIPIFLVCGDSDHVVPYAENGKILADRYRAEGAPLFEIIKAGCAHHPHGLDDLKPLLQFTERYYGGNV